MKRRIALAAALIAQPQLLLLDEPANGLDPERIRWLNHFPKDVEALSLGQLLGDAMQQPELSDKCFESLGEIVSAKARKERRFLETLNDAATGGMLSEEQQGEMLSTMLSPEVAEAMVTLQTLMGEPAAGEEGRSAIGIDGGANPFTSSSETLKVSPSSREVPLSAIQSYLDAAGRGRVVDLSREAEEDAEGGGGAAKGSAANAIQHHRRVEILSPTDAPYGRGLFATAPLRHGDVIFAEVPALHVTMPPNPFTTPQQRPTHCNYCAKPLIGFGNANTTTACRSGCSDVSYCSSSCEAKSYATCHGPICGKTNPLFAQWAAPMLRDYYGGNSNTHMNNADGSSSSSSPPPSPKDQKAALTMYAVGIACATATAAQIHPLKYKPFAMLSGQVSYDRVSALAYTGAIAVGLASALRQQHLYLDDVMSLFALLMDNGFYNESRGGGGSGSLASSSVGPSTLSLFPLMAMVNHSCVPNCVIVDAPASVQAAVANCGGRASSSSSSSSSATLVKQLTVLKDVLPGEQLFINYNHKLMGSGRNALGYEARRALLSQRHFTCTCPKCVLRQ